MPSSVPSAKLMIVAVPTRISVHGSVWARTAVTLEGYCADADAEVAVGDVAEVGDVLADDAAVRVGAELGFQRLER